MMGHAAGLGKWPPAVAGGGSCQHCYQTLGRALHTHMPSSSQLNMLKQDA